MNVTDKYPLLIGYSPAGRTSLHSLQDVADFICTQGLYTQTSKPQSPQTDSKIPETSNPQTKPPSESEPNESIKEPEPSEPEFNIQDWIDFARSYAEDIGLTLNSEAVWCWDNPITASANSKYLQRDLCGTLDKYKRNSDITDVWIWAEQLTESSWEIYIGYA